MWITLITACYFVDSPVDIWCFGQNTVIVFPKLVEGGVDNFDKLINGFLKSRSLKQKFIVFKRGCL